jgi:hypothetical protein
MHVLLIDVEGQIWVILIDVEERNSEKKIPSILGKEKENRGRKEFS